VAFDMVSTDVNHGIVSRGILAAPAGDCVSSGPFVKADELTAPLDPELAHLPNSRAPWMLDEAMSPFGAAH